MCVSESSTGNVMTDDGAPEPETMVPRLVALSEEAMEVARLIGSTRGRQLIGEIAAQTTRLECTIGDAARLYDRATNRQ